MPGWREALKQPQNISIFVKTLSNLSQKQVFENSSSMSNISHMLTSLQPSLSMHLLYLDAWCVSATSRSRELRQEKELRKWKTTYWGCFVYVGLELLSLLLLFSSSSDFWPTFKWLLLSFQIRNFTEKVSLVNLEKGDLSQSVKSKVTKAYRSRSAKWLSTARMSTTMTYTMETEYNVPGWIHCWESFPLNLESRRL